MQPKLIILSDLWGRAKASWIFHYQEPLSKHFEVSYYDCCELGEVDASIYTQEHLHRQFVNGGIENAVQNLVTKVTKPSIVLAFSIGGTVAWRAGLLGWKWSKLYAVSATRLRYEEQKPLGEISLHFGEKDVYRPNDTWMESMNLTAHLEEEKGHEVYREAAFAQQITTQIITNYKADSKD